MQPLEHGKRPTQYSVGPNQDFYVLEALNEDGSVYPLAVRRHHIVSVEPCNPEERTRGRMWLQTAKGGYRYRVEMSTGTGYIVRSDREWDVFMCSLLQP